MLFPLRVHRVSRTRNLSVSAIAARPSALSGVGSTVDVTITSFTEGTTGVIEKQYLRVDVTEEFPFLVSKLSPYYDR
jgi:hypothetical protein